MCRLLLASILLVFMGITFLSAYETYHFSSRHLCGRSSHIYMGVSISHSDLFDTSWGPLVPFMLFCCSTIYVVVALAPATHLESSKILNRLFIYCDAD